MSNEFVPEYVKAGEPAENLAATLYGLTLDSQKEGFQYVDKDAYDCNGITYSIKDQLESSALYGGITAEYELKATRNSHESRPGNLIVNKSDYYLWLVTYKDET